MRKTKIAFIYDFDKTLSPKDMQEYSFLPNLGITSENFWKEVSKEAETQKADNIITYMGMMIEKANANNCENEITKKSLRLHGKNIELFKGVENWFKAINFYAKVKGAEIEHYIISAGNKEILDGVSIAKKFKKIYGCSFRFDKNDVAKAPGLAINYTNKTQFIFRINKGLLNQENHSKINKYIPHNERPIPFHNMVYFGDGDTDVPCMKLVKDKGGYSIAVYKPSSSMNKAKELLKDNRINFYFPADYNKEKELFKNCEIIIDKIVAQNKLIQIEQAQKQKLPKKSDDPS